MKKLNDNHHVSVVVGIEIGHWCRHHDVFLVRHKNTAIHLDHQILS